MEPTGAVGAAAFVLVLLFTYLAVTIVNWLLPPGDAKRTQLLTLVLFIVGFIWIIGVPIIQMRRG